MVDTRSSRRSRQSMLVLACAATMGIIAGSHALAEDVSAPAILQWFEGSWSTIDKRMPDVQAAGYGGLWTPPPGRADQGGLSVGYDQYDRFDLGYAGNPTLYGTENGLKTAISEMHKVGVRSYVDLVWNHS